MCKVGSMHNAFIYLIKISWYFHINWNSSINNIFTFWKQAHRFESWSNSPFLSPHVHLLKLIDVCVNVLYGLLASATKWRWHRIAHMPRHHTKSASKKIKKIKVAADVEHSHQIYLFSDTTFINFLVWMSTRCSVEFVCVVLCGVAGWSVEYLSSLSCAKFSEKTFFTVQKFLFEHQLSLVSLLYFIYQQSLWFYLVSIFWIIFRISVCCTKIACFQKQNLFSVNIWIFSKRKQSLQSFSNFQISRFN